MNASDIIVINTISRDNAAKYYVNRRTINVLPLEQKYFLDKICTAGFFELFGKKLPSPRNKRRTKNNFFSTFIVLRTKRLNIENIKKTLFLEQHLSVQNTVLFLKITTDT